MAKKAPKTKGTTPKKTLPEKAVDVDPQDQTKDESLGIDVVVSLGGSKVRQLSC